MRLRDRRQEIEKAGGRLIAVSVDAPEETARLEARLTENGGPLGYPLVCDPTRATVKAFGVHFAEKDIALPATIILGPDGAVAWKHVAGNVFDRPEEDAIVHAVEALKGMR